MIIDNILDRKDGDIYNAKEFYNYAMQCGAVGEKITRAMDSGTEDDVKSALIRYILDNEYNLNIIKYILNNKWLEGAEYED